MRDKKERGADREAGDTVVLLAPSLSAAAAGDAKCLDPEAAAAAAEVVMRQQKSRQPRPHHRIVSLKWCLFLLALSAALASASLLLAVLLHEGDGPADGVVDIGGEEVGIGGLYVLERFGDDFPGYLGSLGVPPQVAAIVMNASEVVEVAEPAGPDARWTVSMRTDYGDQTLRFRLDVPFVVQQRPGGRRLLYLCSRPRQDQLSCSADEYREEGVAGDGGRRSRRLLTRMTFSRDGFREERVSQAATGTKFFLRVWQDRGRVTADDLAYHQEEEDGGDLGEEDEDYLGEDLWEWE